MESLAKQITIDRSSPVPLYFQFAQQLQNLIETGVLPPGTRLSNEVAMADQFGLSRPTMRQAMQHLVDKGLLARKRGVGTQVVANRIRRQLQFTSLYEDLERDPVGQVESIYRSLGLPGFDAFRPSLAAYASSIAGYRKNRHPALPGPTRRRVADAWRRCFDAWGYAP